MSSSVSPPPRRPHHDVPHGVIHPPADPTDPPTVRPVKVRGSLYVLSRSR